MKVRRVWFLGLFAFLIAAALALVLAVPRLSAAAVWDAKYWNNKSLSGDPVVVRQESDLNFDWGDGSPSGVANDSFSARWKRVLNVAPGTYQFIATMDDGMRVWVDNNLIIDSWYDSQVHTVVASTYISGGDHTVKVEYYEAGGKAVAKLRIEPQGVTIQGWRGEYFSNTALTGTPALVRDDAQIDFNWGTGSPAWNTIPADRFSVRWTRTLNLEPGRYRWTTTTDDGVRLWINGRLLIDRWQDQAPTAHSAELDLPGGAADVRMEYYENVGGALAQLRYTRVGSEPDSTFWRGQYYNNKDLSGSPVLVRNDATINFNWGSGSPGPGINADNFSVRWTQTINLSAGRYRFTATTDDGVRLWVNGQRIIDAWYDRKPTASVGEINLPGGTVEVRMEYYEHTGGATAQLSRTLLPGQPPPTPQPPPANTGTVPGLRLNMRQGPAVSFAIIRVLAQGERVTLLGRNAAATWAKVAASDGLQGWVYAPLLTMTVPVASLPVVTGEVTPPPPATGPTAVVSNAIYVLNVRSGPGITYEPITTVGRGQVVDLLGRNSNATWLKIRTPNGIVGWSSASYLNTSYPLHNLPIAG